MRKKRKILTVAGTRPQLIKLAAVSRVLRQDFREILVDTGQHYDYLMSGIFYDELGIPKPDYHLGIGSGTHSEQTGNMLIKLEKIVFQESPDAILVYGDTNSTLAGALVASKLHIPLFHVEAGLRSYNKKMPEEVNRVITDHLSSLLFAPTESAVKNLAREGIKQGVIRSGDIMFDAVKYNWQMAEKKNLLSKINMQPKQYYLVTIHRAENTDNVERLKAIIQSILRINDTVLFPMHPRTRNKLKITGLYDQVQKSTKVHVMEPVSYLEMLLLEKNAKAIITDSGGVQKEAYFAQVPCFTLRNETEWTETVESGWNRLVDPLKEDLQVIIDNWDVNKPYVENLYGNGQAAVKIVQYISEWFN
jgi:UDP-GlcNAc3NAcA epimerase